MASILIQRYPTDNAIPTTDKIHTLLLYTALTTTDNTPARTVYRVPRFITCGGLGGGSCNEQHGGLYKDV